MSSLYDSFVKIFLVTFCLNILSGIYSPGKKKSQEILNYHWSSVTVCVCVHTLTPIHWRLPPFHKPGFHNLR